jgi:hypothetical protein
MKQNIKKLTCLLVVQLGLVFSLIDNNNLIFAQDQVTATTTFSGKGSILPFTVINPKTGEYILGGTWAMDVNKGKVTNFTTGVQVELYNGSNPHSHQFMNFRQADNEVFGLDTNNSGEIRGTMDVGLNNNIVHPNVSANITIDRGVVMSVAPDIEHIGVQPIIYGLFR